MTAPANAPAPPRLFADPLLPTASCELVAQGAEAVSKKLVAFFWSKKKRH